MTDADTDIDLSRVEEVFETGKSEVANEYLKNGWQMIATHKHVFPDFVSGETTIYCLGRMGSGIKLEHVDLEPLDDSGPFGEQEP